MPQQHPCSWRNVIVCTALQAQTLGQQLRTHNVAGLCICNHAIQLLLCGIVAQMQPLLRLSWYCIEALHTDKLHEKHAQDAQCTPLCVQQAAKENKDGLHWLASISGIFDEEGHLKQIRKASSLTHPKLEEVTDVDKLHIKTAADLQRIIKTKLSLHFCELCFENRQVFTSEQLLYTKAELHEHKTKGDSEGPLKEAQFKGHPKCQCVTAMSVLSSP